MCVQSEKQRLKKSPATCLGPSPPGLHSEPCLHHPVFLQGLLVRKKAPRPWVAPGRSSSPLPNAIDRGWSSGPQNIKYTLQMPYVPRIERFLWVNSSLFKNLLKTWQGIIQPFKWRLWNHMKNTQNVLQAPKMKIQDWVCDGGTAM